MVAGDRRRPAASSAAETVMGSPPNRTADRARRPTSAHASPEETREISPLSLRPGNTQADRLSARRLVLVQGGRTGLDQIASSSCCNFAAAQVPGGGEV